jgi:hypothetical protein
LVVGQSFVMDVVHTESPKWHSIANAILR